jgi:hypothetical protein
MDAFPFPPATEVCEQVRLMLQERERKRRELAEEQCKTARQMLHQKLSNISENNDMRFLLFKEFHVRYEKDGFFQILGELKNAGYAIESQIQLHNASSIWVHFAIDPKWPIIVFYESPESCRDSVVRKVTCQ